MNIHSIFPFLVGRSIFTFYFFMQLILALFVYNDSKKRGLQPIVWTLIVFLIPNFVGFIIYLVFRNSKNIIKTNKKYDNYEVGKCSSTKSTALEQKTNNTTNYETRYKSMYKPKSNNCRYSDFYEDGDKPSSTAIVIVGIVVIIVILGIYYLSGNSLEFIKI